jgi:hypothetical protein
VGTEQEEVTKRRRRKKAPPRVIAEKRVTAFHGAPAFVVQRIEGAVKAQRWYDSGLRGIVFAILIAGGLYFGSVAIRTKAMPQDSGAMATLQAMRELLTVVPLVTQQWATLEPGLTATALWKNAQPRATDTPTPQTRVTDMSNGAGGLTLAGMQTVEASLACAGEVWGMDVVTATPGGPIACPTVFTVTSAAP